MKNLSVFVLALVALGCQSFPMDSGPTQADAEATFRTLDKVNSLAFSTMRSHPISDGRFNMHAGTVTYTRVVDGNASTATMTFNGVGVEAHPERFCGTVTMEATNIQVENTFSAKIVVFGSYSIAHARITQIDFNYTVNMNFDATSMAWTWIVDGTVTADGKYFPINLVF